MKVLAVTLSTALLALNTASAHAAWNHPRYQERDAWTNLGVVQPAGRDDTITLDRRAGRIDDLRIEATRGTVLISEVVVTARDGRRYTLPVHQQLRPGNSQMLRLPGPAQRLASVELNYAAPRGGFWQRMFQRNRAEIAVFGR